jgi:uncharacterized protein YjbI with pentapeptide repeats
MDSTGPTSLAPICVKPNFFTSELSGADFQNTDLRDVHFAGATPREASFAQTDLGGTRFDALTQVSRKDPPRIPPISPGHTSSPGEDSGPSGVATCRCPTVVKGVVGARQTKLTAADRSRRRA